MIGTALNVIMYFFTVVMAGRFYSAKENWRRFLWAN